MVTLTGHQQQRLDTIIAAGNAGEKVLSLAGPAGTGKTTVVSKLGIEAVRHGPWNDVIYWTSTGRAMVVLTSKLMAEVKTFHSGLYGRGMEEKIPLEVNGKIRYGGDGLPVMVRTGRLFFGSPRENFCDPFTLIVVDEASMITMRMHEDLMSVLPFGCAVLYVGDKEQLPPVVGDPVPGFQEDDEPTAELVEIHRQAWDNPVIRLATAIRNGEEYEVDKDDDRILDLRYDEEDAAAWRAEAFYSGRDVTLITGTNAVRQRVNRRVREMLEIEDVLEVGELLCCFRNDHQRGIMNGETFTASKVVEFKVDGFGWLMIITREGDPRPILIQQGTIGMKSKGWSNFRDGLADTFVHSDQVGVKVMTTIREHLIEEGWPDTAVHVPVLTPSQSNDWMRKAFLHVDYGYCLTIHKAQGSEWNEVGAILDNWTLSVLGAKGEYTAVTRTRDRLIRWSV